MNKLEDVLVLDNECSISKIISKQIHERLKENAEIILFGAGAGGINTLSFIQENLKDIHYHIKYFVDNNPLKKNTMFHGLRVLACDEAFANYNDELVVISCGEGDEIIEQLAEYSIPPNRIYIPDISVISDNDLCYIREHLDILEDLYTSLSDEKSKEVLQGILNYKLTHNIQYISEIADPKEEQYFDKELIKYDSNDVFVDCGAYIGDTIQQYMIYNKGTYNQVICIETDEHNANLIRHNLLPYVRGELHEIACWNEKTTLLFDKIGSGSGTVNINRNSITEKVEVEADTIDCIVNGRYVSFIKMDIEGAEYNALQGATETIKKWTPTLMISVYHKQDDLIKIPTLIKSLNKDYRIYLRHYRSMSIQETVLYAISS